MKVVVKDSLEEMVVLIPDTGDKRAPCVWARQCPRKKTGEVYLCDECPACGVKTRMTHAEAVKWWREQ